MKTNVFIADDHQMVIDGLRLLLGSMEDYAVTGTSNNGKDALSFISDHRPDIALLDLRMPEKDGLQVTRFIKDHKLPVRVIILSMHNDKRYINDARNYGADGYLLKNAGKDELVKALSVVRSGGKYFNFTEENAESAHGILTPRELDILSLLINQNTTLQMADKLRLSHYTIETHRKNIMRKTGAKNLAGLVKYAVDNGISFDN